MKALFIKQLTFMTAGVTALFGMSLVLKAQQAGASASGETAVVLAEKLVLESPVVKAPGLVKWLGNPSVKAGNNKRMEWLDDGSVMYATSRESDGRTEIWKPEIIDGLETMVLKGYYSLGNEWGVSPDGRWLAGVKFAKNRLKFRGYRADTLEVVWEKEVTSSSSDMVDLFSLDSQSLMRMEEFNDQATVTILRSDTGEETFSRSFSEAEGFGESELRVVAGKDYFLMSPGFDLQKRVTKLDAKTGAIETVTEATEGFSELEAMELSRDGDWLVLWDEGRYQVMKRSKQGRYSAAFEGEIEITYNRFGTPINRLNSVRISPDSQTLVVSGGLMHKVVRLADQKVLHSSTEDCRCGHFEPNGRMFISTCFPYRVVDTQSWEYRMVKDQTLRESVEQVSFSPDGKRLAVFGCLDIDVWDWQADESQPPFKLVTASSPARLCRPKWKDNETVYGGNFTEFLKWRLPAKKQGLAQHQRVQGEKLFDTYASIKSESSGEEVKATWQSIAVSTAGEQCLVSMDGEGAYTELKFADKPGLVKQLNIPKGSPYPIRENVFFKPDGRMLFYKARDRSSRDQLYAYDIESGVLNQSTREAQGELIGYDDVRNRLVGAHPSQIKVWDATTLKEVAAHKLPQNYFWEEAAALSRDGSLLAYVGREAGLEKVRGYQVMLINVDDGKVVGATVKLDQVVKSLAFSPDGKHLATGLTNGVVGIWEVGTLLKEGALSLDGVNAEKTAPPATASPRSLSKTWPDWEFKGPLPDGFQLSSGDGEVWKTLPDGSIGCAEDRRLGVMKIDGKDLQSIGQRSRMTAFGIPGFLLRTNLVSEVEGLRIYRSLRGSAHGAAEWRDELENVGSTPLKVKLSFVAALGGDIESLRLPDRESLERRAGDELVVSEKAQMVGSFNAGDESKGNKGGVLRFATAGAKQRPQLRWDQDAKAVMSEWTIELQPAERCLVVHQYVRTNRSGKDASWLVAKHALIGGFTMVPLMDGLPTPLNAGYEDEREESKNSFIQARQLDGEGWLVDSLGLRWKTNRGSFRGLASELGMHTVLGLRLNGEPAAFEILRRSGPERWLDEIYEASVSKGDWKVERRTVYSKEHAAYATHDTVVNPGPAPVKAVVEAMVAGNGRIAKLITEDNKELDLAAPALPTGDRGKFLVVVFEGEQEPCVLVALDSRNGETPKLKLTGDNVLAFRYEMELSPGERKVLKHVAAPRPLAVFGSLEAAVSSWNLEAMLEHFASVPPLKGTP